MPANRNGRPVKAKEKKVDWMQVEALFRSGLDTFAVAKKLKMAPSTLANKCKRELGKTFYERFANVMPPEKKFKGTKQGGPKANIDWAKVKNLLMIGTPSEHLSLILDIHPLTLAKRSVTDLGMTLMELRAACRAMGYAKIRGKQWELAFDKDNPSTQWLQHLSKHELGQHDRIEQDITVAGVTPESKQKLASILAGVGTDEK